MSYTYTEEDTYIEMDMLQFGFEDLEKELDTEVIEDDFNETEELPITPYAKKGNILILVNTN